MTNEQLIRIDRMVDGELDCEQQRDLLLHCQEQDQWRDLALAYVESQALRSDLKTYVDDGTAKPRADVEEAKRDSESARSWNPMALAAAIFLSLGLGYGLGTWWLDDAGVASGIAELVPQQPRTEKAKPSSMQFMVANPGTNELQSINLPVLNASDLGPNWQTQLRSQVPEDLLREMRERGVNMQQTHTITPVRLSNGKRVLVPIDYYIEHLYQ